MVVYLVSGDGKGAGKSTYVNKIVDAVYPLAYAVRLRLARKYPHYNWFSTDQVYKESTQVPEYGRGYSVRDCLVEYAEQKCEQDAYFWVKQSTASLNALNQIGTGAHKRVGVDDVRKLEELEYFRNNLNQDIDVIHFHVKNGDAVKEPEFDNEHLITMADYVVSY